MVISRDYLGLERVLLSLGQVCEAGAGVKSLCPTVAERRKYLVGATAHIYQGPTACRPTCLDCQSLFQSSVIKLVSDFSIILRSMLYSH